jgi:hypothetical protein
MVRVGIANFLLDQTKKVISSRKQIKIGKYVSFFVYCTISKITFLPLMTTVTKSEKTRLAKNKVKVHRSENRANFFIKNFSFPYRAESLYYFLHSFLVSLLCKQLF